MVTDDMDTPPPSHGHEMGGAAVMAILFLAGLWLFIQNPYRAVVYLAYGVMALLLGWSLYQIGLTAYVEARRWLR